MSKAGTLDLASGLGGKIEKDDVLNAVDKYIFSLCKFYFRSVLFYLMQFGHEVFKLLSVIRTFFESFSRMVFRSYVKDYIYLIILDVYI